MSRKRQKRISPVEAFRAIYIDFEGLKGEAPSLIGIATQYDFRQAVFAPALKGAADAEGLRFVTVEVVAQELVRWSDDENRLIVGYSQFERRELEQHGGGRGRSEVPGRADDRAPVDQPSASRRGIRMAAGGFAPVHRVRRPAPSRQGQRRQADP
jgi:hypothetical protein